MRTLAEFDRAVARSRKLQQEHCDRSGSASAPRYRGRLIRKHTKAAGIFFEPIQGGCVY